MRFKNEDSLKEYLFKFVNEPHQFGVLVHLGNYAIFKVYPKTKFFETSPHQLQSINDPDAIMVLWIRKLNNGEYSIPEH